MPSTLSNSARRQPDALDNYDIGELSDDPFASPSPDAASRKRKDAPSGLGIDEEVLVQKRARVPNVKLDEDRLLSENGIPKLKKRARDLKIKGKGHEFSDAARLLSFYQLWLDDLFPKAKFLDALAMVEKAGHKKKLAIQRNQWIEEGKPKSHSVDDDEEADEAPAREGTSGPAVDQSTAHHSERPMTPTRVSDDNIPDDEDLYDATPRRSSAAPRANVDDAPDEDDLDALMAEAEGADRPSAPQKSGRADSDEDGFDALMAEAESHDARKPDSAAAKPQKTAQDDFADEEAAMQEMDGLR